MASIIEAVESKEQTILALAQEIDDAIRALSHKVDSYIDRNTEYGKSISDEKPANILDEIIGELNCSKRAIGALHRTIYTKILVKLADKP